MKKTHALTITTLIILTAYLMLAGSSWGVGLCCVRINHCAAASDPSHDCDDPCEQVPNHGPCSSPLWGNGHSLPGTCHCCVGPPLGLRYYLGATTGQQASERLYSPGIELSRFAETSSGKAAGRYTIPPKRSGYDQVLACRKTVLLVC